MMTMNLRYTSVILTCLVLGIGCSRTSSPRVAAPEGPAEDGASSTATPGVRGEVFDLKLKVEAGQEYRMEMYKDQLSEVSIMGQLVPTRRVEVIEGTWEILETNVYREFFNARFTFDRARFSEFGNRGTHGYDSAVDDSPPNNERGVMLAGLVGNGIDVTITPSGRIVDVRETDELRERIISSLQTDEMINDPEAVERVRREALTDEALSLLLESYLTTLPGTTFRIGDQWTEIRPLNEMGSINERTIHVVERHDETITVQRESIMKPAREGGKMGRRVSDLMAFDIQSGTASSTAIIDRNTGWVKESTTTGETRADLIMRAMETSNMPRPTMVTHERVHVRLLGDGVEPTRNFEIRESVE